MKERKALIIIIIIIIIVVYSGLALKLLIQQIQGAAHQIGAHSEHQNAELHLRQNSVAVEVAGGDHRPQIRIRQAVEAEKRSVPFQAIEGDEAERGVHQKPKPLTELSD